MRFMMLLKADAHSEAGVLPSEDTLAEMAHYNEQLVKAGVLLDAQGLKPTSAGARVSFAGGKTSVSEGPFNHTPDLICGYWMIQVKSKDEALEWAKRAPFHSVREHGGVAQIELRQVFELEDFAPGEAIEHHRELGREIQNQRAH